MKCFKTVGGGCIIIAVFLSAFTSGAQSRKILAGHLPNAAAPTAQVGRLEPTARLDLAIGLPLRNRDGLHDFLRELYNPVSTNFHHYLTPAAFAEKFGPTPDDYQAVLDFARKQGLTVSGTHPGRMVLEVTGSAADVEQAFQVRLLTYQHPTENRKFYAPDREPSVPPNIPILDISGLDDLAAPRPLAIFLPLTNNSRSQPDYWLGSGPGNTFISGDLRSIYNAFSQGGMGQSVGLLELDACYFSDIRAYEKTTGLPDVPVRAVLLGGFNGTPGRNNAEVALDTEMAMAMAPNLSQIILYEAPNHIASYTAILIQMAEDDAASQLSSSWFPPSGPSETLEQILMQLGAQGQSIFQASGDFGAYTNGVPGQSTDPHETIVGGTILGFYQQETVWNNGVSNQVSGGGISTTYRIPSWQEGIDMSANGGSTNWRNSPDVSAVADNLYVRGNDGEQLIGGGTSASAPLWAGFTALVNEQAAANGLPPVGFLNPALYAVGRSLSYSSCFRDVTTGNNTTILSPSHYFAFPGYDLCTGWGSPGGQSLIDILTTKPAQLSITPDAGFTSSGPVGGPFNTTAETLTMTNVGWVALPWQAESLPAWLDVSTNAGLLAPGAGTTLMISLNATATNLGAGNYAATVVVTDLTDNTSQSLQFSFQPTNAGAGALEVDIGPSNAVQAGAQWDVDGGPWQNSGQVVGGLAPGSHTVYFSEIANWAAPPIATVDLVANETNIFPALYPQEVGSLTVFLRPQDVAVGGPQWRLDGGPWMDSGKTVSGLTPTNHMVSFSAATDWITPSNMTVLINGNQTTVAVGAYTEPYRFTTIGGQPGKNGSADGTQSNSLFFSPAGIAVGNGGSLFIADTSNNVIRQMTQQGADWSVSTIAGLAGSPGDADGTNGDARFSAPIGVASDLNGNVYVADSGNSSIRELTPSGTNWSVSTICTGLTDISGIAVDSNGNVWSTGASPVLLYFFTNSSGTWNGQQLLWGFDLFGESSGLVIMPNGLIYSDFNNTVSRLDPSPPLGYGACVAGTAAAGSANGEASAAQFSSPQGIAADNLGNVYVADTGNNLIRKMAPVGSDREVVPFSRDYDVSVPDYTVVAIGGAAGVTGTNDGTNFQALFNRPAGAAVNGNGNLFIADTGNNTIRMGTELLCRLQVVATPEITNVQTLQFQVDGGTPTTYGSTVLVAPGVHTITFQPIPWGISPSNAVVTITSNQTLTATYTHVFASLQITLGPTKAVQAGAAWQLDGGNWQSNGATLSAIPYGQHQLNFSNIPGWQTLPTYSFTIDNPTNSMRFTYTAIDTTPPAVSILSPKPGQQWTNQVFTTRGVARDNVAVASVWYQINGNGWNQAIGTNSWSSLPVVLPSGPSAVQACAVDTSGNVSKTITTRFDNAPEAPLTLTVNGNGTVSPKSGVHYLYLGKPYSFTAIPGEKTAFAGWSGAAVSDDFTMTITIETNAILQANFVPNPLAPAAGAYEGLFYSPNTIAPPSSGFFSAVVAPSGAFSGKLLFESGSSSISGRFSSSGQSSNFIPRAMNPIALTMSLDITNRRITGDLQTPNWVALLQAYAASFSKSNPAPWAGSYAMQILPGQGFGTIPAKNGSGLVSVGATGNVTFSGTLGDGTRVSQSAILSPQGQWPFFQSLYFGSGVILGWLNLTNSPADLSGELMWIKTPATNATGFFATNEVQGSVRTNK